VRQDLTISEGQLRDYQARLGKPFTHEGYLSELTSLRDQLKAGLSGAPQKKGKEEGLSISELAVRIKAIKAAHSVEPTPQRVRQKHSSAEEPITARIRRRTEALPVSDRATEPDVGALTTLVSQPPESTAQGTVGDIMHVISADHTSIAQEGSVRSEPTLQERGQRRANRVFFDSSGHRRMR
jgi:hypothetical protein